MTGRSWLAASAVLLAAAGGGDGEAGLSVSGDAFLLNGAPWGLQAL